ncbi:MAG TPA: mechanosensitive ion channel domain-containing protein [Nitrososphaerales archaeon]|nr:mechanosensitive ion channel domain-containing protein [Nitrososphaerales archaeon]
MEVSLLTGLFQIVSTTNSTSTAAAVAQVKPLWLTAAEVVALIVGVVVVGTLLANLFRSVALKAGASKAVANSIRSWMGVLMIISVVAGVAYLTGISSQLTTLTISGIAGLAISLALQNTISNVISGVLLLSDGIIRLGDDIQYGGPGGVRGEVVKLSLRTTWIRTQEGVITIIGNTNLSAGPILNYTAKARLGRKLEV